LYAQDRENRGHWASYANKLVEAGVKTTDELLKAGATAEGRKQLTEKTGVSETLILEWVNLADLFRIKGIGEEYYDLLEEAGVDTVVELAARDPVNLHVKILEINKDKKLVRRPLTLTQVKNWVKQAKKLPRKVEY
jgi:predicted flap endonuclease-1-like 5' DNA nuclease